MNQKHLCSPDNECRQVILSSALAIAMIVGLSFFIALIINHFLSPAPPPDLAEFTEGVASYIYPEPTERRVFQIMVLLAPFVALLSHAVVMKLSPSLVSSLFFECKGYAIVALLTLAWVNSWAFLPNYMSASCLGSFSFIFPITTGLLLFVYAYGHTATLRGMDALIKKWFTPILAFVLAVCFLIAVSFRVFSWEVLFENRNYAILHDLNPVLYYASLAETGNYLTTFGAPQYGFYSLYLKPVFSFLGLTIYSFSFVMTLLYLLGVIAVAVPIFRNLHSPYLKLLLVPVLCAIQGSLGQVYNEWDPCFAYYPIRFLIPALSVLMLYIILRTERDNTRICLAALFSFLLGFLAFWNFDSGIITIIAWTAFSLLFATVETIRRRASNPALSLSLVVVGMLMLGIGTASIILITCDKSGISFGRLFEMQRMFYMTGFNMLPMPLTPHPWMAVMGVYVAALVLTLPVILRTGLQCSPRRMLALYIAVIGIGLFTYYQGRSHDRVLPAVVWPAILCCFLACDWCLSADSAKQRSAIRLLALPFMVFAVSLTVELSWNFPWYLNKMILLHQESTKNELNSSTLPASYTFDWLSKYRNEPPGSVLILSSAESVYYVESGLHPLALLPSEQERFFFRWQEADLQKILQTRTLKHLFISPILSQVPEYKRIDGTIRSLYKFEESFLLEHWILKEQ